VNEASAGLSAHGAVTGDHIAQRSPHLVAHRPAETPPRLHALTEWQASRLA
jgi:hypothetical protein